MANFEPIVQWLLYQEDDHKQPGKIVAEGDGGGYTRLGITSANFGALVGEEFFTTMPFADAVRTAKIVYQKYFWLGDGIQNDEVAAVLLSASVNIRGGKKKAVELLQQVLTPEISVDGVLGPSTLGVLNSKDGKSVANLFRTEWIQFYQHLAAVNPDENRFLQGWINRATFPYPSALVPNIYA